MQRGELATVRGAAPETRGGGAAVTVRARGNHSVAMDVLVLIDKLDDLVHNAKQVPLTDQVRVDKEEIYDILDQMRATIPEEIKQARWIVKERQEMLAEAKREAERIVKEARERQERLISNEEVTKAAERAAEDIVEDARAREREIRLGAEDYADEILNTLEVNLSKFIAAVSGVVTGCRVATIPSKSPERRRALPRALTSRPGPVQGGGSSTCLDTAREAPAPDGRHVQRADADPRRRRARRASGHRRQGAADAVALGTDARERLRDLRAALAARRRGQRQPRNGRLRELHLQTNALAHSLRARGVARATASRSSAATTAASFRRPSPRRSSERTCCFSTRPSPRRRSRRSARSSGRAS